MQGRCRGVDSYAWMNWKRTIARNVNERLLLAMYAKKFITVKALRGNSVNSIPGS